MSEKEINRLELAVELDPLRRIPLLNSLARACERSELSYAISLLREALSLCDRIDAPVFRGQTHINLARCLLSAASLDQALEHLDLAEKIFQDLQDKDALTDVQYVRSLVYLRKGNSEKAFDLASVVYQERKLIQSAASYSKPVRMSVDRLSPENISPERSRRNNEYKLGTASRVLALVEASRLDYTKALYYIDANFELWERLGEKGELASSLENAGLVYRRIQDNSSAIDFFERALAIYRASGANGSIMNVLNSLAAIHTDLGNYNTALSELTEAWAIPSRSNYVTEELGTCIQFAKYYIARNDFENAELWVSEGLKIAIAKNIESSLPQLYSLSGKISFFKNDFENAVMMLRKGLEQSKKAGQLGPEVRCLKYLYQLYKNREEFDEALSYLEQYQAVEAAFLKMHLESGTSIVKNRFAKRITQTGEAVSREEHRELSEEVENLTEELALTKKQVRKKDELLRRLEKESRALINYSEETQELVKPILTKINEELQDSAFERDVAEKLQNVLTYFMKALQEKYPSLTKAELRVCALLRMDMSSREIASALRLSIRTIENHRMHIRQKLHADEDNDIQDIFKKISTPKIKHE